jgi:hypothetical protein
MKGKPAVGSSEELPQGWIWTEATAVDAGSGHIYEVQATSQNMKKTVGKQACTWEDAVEKVQHEIRQLMES